MPAIRRAFSTLPRLASAFTRHFETPSARFRLAVASGFVIVAVSVLVVGVGARIGIADTMWGSMEIPGVTSPPAASAQYLRSDATASEGARERRTARRKTRHKHLAASGDTPVPLARKSICVRTCDGFVFPVGTYYGEGDRAAHEATCQSECPGAKTALYVLPAGSDSIADATQAATGKAYSQMPDAFHYTNYVDETCSCHPAGGGRTKSLLRDFTLRRGDAVMTPKGLEVFHGGRGYPFKRRDFVALNKSRDIRQATRATLKAIERASLVNPTAIAGWRAPASPQTAAVKPTPAKSVPVNAAPAKLVPAKSVPAMTSDAGQTPAKGPQGQAKS